MYEYTNAVANLRFNNSLFTVVDADHVSKVDLAGAIGVMKLPDSYYDHVYASLNNDGSRIGESFGGGGICVTDNKGWIDGYKKRTNVYLKLKLPSWRIIK
ncbi:MAG TPA: hypothetical protein PLH80_06345 [Spirochaetota bacterium]|nr:hypothetical protein [Spirochaetota bacterium]HPK45023.1 hypothetical protein [Spirochaetota bacterium]HQG42726.1 hypothetical protein [Spirochaetota bacterium]HQI38162.1 hypothetical protein [Spirochaetota bacterium]